MGSQERGWELTRPSASAVGAQALTERWGCLDGRRSSASVALKRPSETSALVLPCPRYIPLVHTGGSSAPAGRPTAQRAKVRPAVKPKVTFAMQLCT